MSIPGTTSTRYFGPSIFRLDLPRGTAQPSVWRWIPATILAGCASLLACFGLAHLAVILDPALAGYGHFRFGDYGRLTIIGVVAACAGWPVMTWLTTSARRLYLWLAITVTVVSFAPDVWILHLGEPAAAVATLMVMHFALAVVTFPAMVFLAPQRATVQHDAHG